jgi:IS5 family transposase
VNAAVDLKLIRPQDLQRVIVDTTVQEKAIAHPTDSRLLETARAKLVLAAKAAGVALKQTYAAEGSNLQFRAGRYAHARQFQRTRRVIRRQRTLLGRLLRETQRKVALPTTVLQEVYAKVLQLLEQTTKRRNTKAKLYSWHAPEVQCINKGKSRQPYEFVSKVGIAATLQGNLVVGARAFAGNPYDRHTLAEQLEQTGILMQDTGTRPTEVSVDLGYRGVDAANPGVKIIHRG